MINIRDALDFLERAKSSAENIERYAHDCDFGEARLVILELIAEIERLQDLIDKPPEEADWVADYHLLQSALDDPIIDAARKWHAAYRKAQNSNLMRAKEVERLRSREKEFAEMSNVLSEKLKQFVLGSAERYSNIFEIAKQLIVEHGAKDARIKELEEQVDQSRTAIVGRIQECQGCMAHGESDYMQRLEAAFLEAKETALWDAVEVDGPKEGRAAHHIAVVHEQAREVLERIRSGKDVP